MQHDNCQLVYLRSSLLRAYLLAPRREERKQTSRQLEPIIIIRGAKVPMVIIHLNHPTLTIFSD